MSFEDTLLANILSLWVEISPKKVVRCPADKENRAADRESYGFPMQSVNN